MIKRKPHWLKSNKLGARKSGMIRSKLHKYHLHTVCESAKCPNQGECFERGTATFMILGEICTRNCAFCAVRKDKKNIKTPDPDEPKNIALVARELNLKHIVITTVTRDDLPDGGANQFAETISEIRKICEQSPTIEVLISDLQGKKENLKIIFKAKPDVINHNLETIPRLYPKVRPMANYQRSLKVLQRAQESGFLTKSGIMLGLGEKEEEVLELMADLRNVKTKVMTIGQYMQPSKDHFPVIKYVHPEVFSKYRKIGLKMGFKLVESAPLVRSSYHAEKVRTLIEKS